MLSAGLATTILTVSVAQAGALRTEVVPRPDERCVDIRVDGEPFTSYVWRERAGPHRDERPRDRGRGRGARPAGVPLGGRGHARGHDVCLAGEKIPILEEILEKAGVSAGQVANVGDGFIDVVIMHRVGLAVATANARPDVKAEAHHVIAASGGRGAIREVVELLLRAQGRWEAILAHYEIGGGPGASRPGTPSPVGVGSTGVERSSP